MRVGWWGASKRPSPSKSKAKWVPSGPTEHDGSNWNIVSVLPTSGDAEKHAFTSTAPHCQWVAHKPLAPQKSLVQPTPSEQSASVAHADVWSVGARASSDTSPRARRPHGSTTRMA